MPAGRFVRNKMFFFGGWQGTTIANRGANLVQFAPTTDERNGNFATCGAACNRALTDPLTGLPFPGNQIPVSRFDPAAVNVLQFMPQVTGDGRLQVPRLIGQDDNQVVGKVDQQLGQSNQLGVRYFFDHFTNDPTYTEGNLLTYRNPTLQSRVRAQNVVGSWTRTLSNTSLNELRVGYNRMHARRFPPTNNVPSMQELGVRLPIYPGQPSISEINASGYFNIGDNLEAVVRPQWSRAERPVHLGEGEAQHPGRRRSAALHGGDRQPVPASGTLHLRRQPHRPPDCRLPARLRPDLRPGHRRVQGLQRLVRVAVRSGRFQSVAAVHVEPGSALRVHAAVARDGRPHRVLFARGLQQQRALDRCSRRRRGAKRSAATPAFPTTAPTRSRTTSARVLGFAWDLTGDGKTSLRGGGGMFYDQHRDGESGNGGVNAAPWSIRLSVTRPAGPFSDPYRGRTDFNLITDETIGTQQAAVPDAGAD